MKNLTYQQLETILKQYLDISRVQEKSNKRDAVFVRQIAHAMAAEFTTKTYSDIGFEYGGRDHSTVYYSRKVVNNRCETERDYRRLIDQIRHDLRNVLENGDASKEGAKQIRRIKKQAYINYKINANKTC